MRTATATLALTLLGASHALAQPDATYRVQVTTEATGSRDNPASPLLRPGQDAWTTRNLFVALGSGSWEAGRLKLAAGAALTATHGDFALRTREAYARVSAASWMDLEAGKRLVRWGVGYGFSPAGVLDPPRVATDPTDRLGLNEGRPMGRVELFRGDSSLTVAAASSSRLVAARLRTVLPGGFEVAAIGAAAPGARASWGGTLTHVVGQRLEWHAEALVHDDRDRAATGTRQISAVAGLQYTLGSGTNVVLEYHRNGNGLDGDQWDAVLRGARAPGKAPGRRQFLFIRAARAAAGTLAPEMILIAGLDDGSRVLVPGLTWSPRQRVQIHARATRLLGGRRTIAGLAPVSASLTLGATLRF